MTLELDRFFDVVDTCHYKLFAIDRPTDEQLGEYNRKHLQIYIKSFNGVEIFVSNATEESEIDYIKQSLHYDKNFTIAASKTLYMQLTPLSTSNYSALEATVEFKYYEYDPKCAEFTYWNGTECDPNYNEYCASLLP